jgi:hypothetical protein
MRGQRVFKRNPLAAFLFGALPFLFTLLIVAIVYVGIMQAGEASEAEGVRLLQEALMRVAIHSYAVNGYFPESLAYIEENFAIYIDHTRFIVNYQVFAANVLPDIRVFPIAR